MFIILIILVAALTPRYKYETNGMSKPRDRVRATIIRQGANNLQLTGWKEHMFDTPYTLDKGTDTAWILQDTRTDDHQHDIFIDIRNVTARAVSDGSFLPHHKIGAAAWIIESYHSNYSHDGRVLCPGPTKIQCSHRSKLMGLLGMVYHIHKICTVHNIADGQIEIGCDRMGAITAITSHVSLICSSWKHFDLISSIRKLMQQSPIKWTVRHIPAHQDDEIEFNNLNRWVQLNVIVDAGAKAKVTECLPNINMLRQQPFFVPFEKCSIYWHDRRTRGIKICSELKRTLTNLIHTNTIRQHWMKGRKFSGYTESFVDWDATQRSRRNVSKS
jgi:hypothetical protein